MKENETVSNKFNSSLTKWIVIGISLFFALLIIFLAVSSVDNPTPEVARVNAPPILLYLAESEGQKQIYQHDLTSGTTLATGIYLPDGEAPNSLVWRDENHIIFVSRQQDFIELDLESGETEVFQSQTRTLFSRFRSTVGSIDWCPGSKRFVVTGSGVSADYGWVEILYSSGKLHERVSTRSGYTDIACSPEGTSVAVADTIETRGLVSALGTTPLHEISDESEIFLTVINLSDGEAMRLTNAGFAIQPGWSPDGSRIAFVGQFETNTNGRQLYLINLEDKEREVLTNFEKADLATPAWSPNGNLIAFVKDGDIWLLEVETGELTQLTQTPEEESAPVWHP
jgi:Tol biopolymer transport system component